VVVPTTTGSNAFYWVTPDKDTHPQRLVRQNCFANTNAFEPNDDLRSFQVEAMAHQPNRHCLNSRDLQQITAANATDQCKAMALQDKIYAVLNQTGDIELSSASTQF